MRQGKSYTAGHFELRVEGHTMVFSEAVLPRSPPPLDGILILRRDKGDDILLTARHRSGAKKNCTLFVYNTYGGLVGRYFFMGTRVVKIETIWRAGSFTGTPGGPVPSVNPTNQVAFNFSKIEH